MLGKDSQDKISLLVGFEAGGDDQIVARRELEPAGDFPQVDEGLTAGAAGVVSEEVGGAAAWLFLAQGVDTEAH